MSGRKWLVMLGAAFVSVMLLWGLWNVVIDPFGTFGTECFRWDDYSETLNPHNAKSVYVSRHFDEFDSYIVGSSSAASYLPETFEKYIDGNFYNMFHYGSNITLDRQIVSYLVENDGDVKNIVLIVGLNEVREKTEEAESLTTKAYYSVSGESFLTYYSSFLFADPSYALEKLQSRRQDTILPQVFDCIRSCDGCYDKRVRDVEPISSQENYLSLHGEDYLYYSDGTGALENSDECINAIAEIKKECDKHGVNLLVILSPVYKTQLDAVSTESLDEFYGQLAKEVDFWNFAISPISYDSRYFYDVTHTRNLTADMVAGRIFNDGDVYYPDGFGIYCTGETEISSEKMKSDTALDNTSALPILLYHHISDMEQEGESILSSEHFRNQMELIRQNGYNVVSISQISDYVKLGSPLPDNPVMIMFDDGYLSNYELAYPILKEYGYSATIFVIGSSFGHKQYYKDTDKPLIPHFGKNEAPEMISSGLISIQSHTYDMHQYAKYENESPAREIIVPFDGETEEEYRNALCTDTVKTAELFEANSMEKPIALAFPQGAWEPVTNVILRERGYEMTFTTDAFAVNYITCGIPQSLINLGRYTVSGSTTDEDILSYLSAR